MSLQQERPPAYSHDPESLQLPSVPQLAPPRGNATQSIHLPDLRSLGLPESTAHTSNHSYNGPTLPSTVDWRNSPALHHNDFPRVPSAAPRSSTEMDISSPRESIMSVDELGNRAPSVVSIEDPDVRIAAEALSGLGNPDAYHAAEFVRSPSNRSVTLPSQSSPTSHTRHASMSHIQEPEPLLQLLTTSHPWLGGTINGSLSAYETTKSYTPRFVQASATYLERNIGSPVANTVGAVGRRTGVEGGLRRYLGDVGRRPSDLERGDADEDRHKRRRVARSPDPQDGMAMDIERGPLMPLSRPRTSSRDSTTESLPAYDDNRSPQYEERSPRPEKEDSREPSQSQEHAQARRPAHWSTQLIMTTSGLGVAMSDTSLKSLKYCLGILRRATNHLGSVMRALGLVLADYERACAASASNGQGHQQQQQQQQPQQQQGTAGNAEAETRPAPEDEAARLATRIQALSTDILNTLKTVVNTVSRYTGGALPTNAANFVRSQLLSVPERWRLASQHSRESAAAGSSETVRRTNRMLAFAKEGLDMMAQRGGVVGEDWGSGGGAGGPEAGNEKGDERAAVEERGDGRGGRS
ncbi:transcriptional regulator opi1 [Coniosporium tulheliwenetii]|uniref:Transcriptional regulator opi1 n=1 Tax=Coniosporium tulheliwenetii TaxID=3383036 RepID=A0ACC2YXD4_9PEZI|nr:transcriptional regulator opi1 [Cladosporium sp. JES 115]